MVDVEASFARFEQQAQQEQQEQQAQQMEEDGLQSCVVSHEIKCHEMCFGVVVAELNEKLKRWKRVAAEKAKEEAEKAFWAYEIEYSLDRVFLGADRHGRQYFCFIGAPDRLFARSLDGEWFCVEATQLPQLAQALTQPEEKELARNVENAAMYFASRLPWDASHRLASQDAVQVAPLRAQAVLRQLFATLFEQVPQCAVCGAFVSESCRHCSHCHLDFDDSLFAQHACVAEASQQQTTALTTAQETTAQITTQSPSQSSIHTARQMLMQLELAIPFACLTKKARVYWTAEKRAAWQMKGGCAIRV